MAKPRKIFVNLPVRDLQRSVGFFTDLGFAFDLRFTDAKASCMIVSEEAFVMLMEEDRFRDFTKKELCGTGRTEGIFALSAESRKEVDTFADKALASGATAALPPQDLGFMYQRSFYDPDGHHWEIVHVDESAFAQR
jgi:uncharacterized protein